MVKTTKVKLLVQILLENVLFVEGLKHNLLNIS